MAEFWSNNDRGYRIRLWIDQVSQNIPGNSSQVRVRLALLNTTTTFTDYNCSAWVDLNGQRLNWSGRPSVLSYNQTVWLIDQTITVGHNADGSKVFGLSASFSGSGGWSPGTLSISGNSFTLTTIPRSSSVSVGSGTIGSPVTINIDRQSPSFKHTVRYVWGNKTGTIASNVDTSTSWTIPLNFADDIPNATSGTGTLIIETYGDGKKIGEKSTTFTATVSDDVKPKLTGFTLTDGNTAAGNVVPGEQAFISVLSNIKVNFGQATGAYGSTITGYYAEIVGKNQSTNQNGGALVDDKGEITFDTEANVGTLEYLKKFNDEKLVPDVVSTARGDQATLFANGNLAMFVSGPWEKETLDKAADTAPYKVAVLPEGKQKAETLVTDSYVISSISKNKDLAWKFVEFMGQPEYQRPVSEAFGWFPILKEEFEDERFKTEFMQAFAASIEYGISEPQVEDWDSFNKAFLTAVQKALTGEMGAKEALDEAQSEVAK